MCVWGFLLVYIHELGYFSFHLSFHDFKETTVSSADRTLNVHISFHSAASDCQSSDFCSLTAVSDLLISMWFRIDFLLTSTEPPETARTKKWWPPWGLFTMRQLSLHHNLCLLAVDLFRGGWYLASGCRDVSRGSFQLKREAILRFFFLVKAAWWSRCIRRNR